MRFGSVQSGSGFGTHNRNPTELEQFGSGSGLGFWSVISVITELCSPYLWVMVIAVLVG